MFGRGLSGSIGSKLNRPTLVGSSEKSPPSLAKAPKEHLVVPGVGACKDEASKSDFGEKDDFPRSRIYRYEVNPSESSPSPLFSVFGWLQALAGFYGNDMAVDLEPLRLVAADGSEWGAKHLNALIELEQEMGGIRQQIEEGSALSSKGVR